MAAKLARKDTLEPQYEDFEPVADLQESPDKYILLLNLPGFKKEDFRVQLDGLGNLTVKGQKPIGENKFKRLNVVFQLPEDSDLEKIRGKFERDTLSLTLPKREKVIEKKEEEQEPPKEEAKVEEKKEEDKTKEEDKASEKKEQVEPKEEQQEANGHEGKEEEESRPKEELKPSLYEKFKDRIAERMMGKDEEKKMIRWRKRICQEMEELSNKVSTDNLLESLNKNKKVIAVGVAAFSIGFVVSRKLSCKK